MEHEKNWEFLKGKYTARQLGHAYLFSGRDVVDVKQFAKNFVKLINESIAGSPLAIEKEQFPDLLVVASRNSESSLKNEKDMMEIDVKQIRDVNNFLSYKPYYGNYKAVIIEHADRLNTEAQNSFLKTLEEPKGKTIIFLLSSKPDTLLSTIFSRCQTMTFLDHGKYRISPAEQKTLQELLGIINTELAVKFQYTKKVNLEGDNFSTMLETLQRHFRNLLLMKIGAMEESIPRSSALVSASLSDFSTEKLKNIIRLIEKLNHQVSITNASPKLALEVLLMEI